MPSAELYPIQTMTTRTTTTTYNNNNGGGDGDQPTTTTTTANNFKLADVEGLVLEIKENLRLSGGTHTLKSIPCSQLSRKTSRSSPYCRYPTKYYCNSTKSSTKTQQDPYELLQALIRSENLINEAVKRVQMGFTQHKNSRKQFYYDDSDEEPLVLFDN